MSLSKDHINNIDLFLNSKNVLGVEARDVSTGAVKRFDSRSKFLNYLMENNSNVINSKESLSGSLTYRILTDREFFGYRVKLIDISSKITRGSMGKSLMRHGGIRTCLMGSTSKSCKGKVNRHRDRVWLVDLNARKVKEFDNLGKYREYARENDLKITVKRSHIKGMLSVRNNNYLIASKKYLNNHVLDKYYWVKGKNGKFLKGFNKFDELKGYLGESDENKVRGAIGNGSVVRGKRIVVRRSINDEFFKYKGLIEQG